MNKFLGILWGCLMFFSNVIFFKFSLVRVGCVFIAVLGCLSMAVVRESCIERFFYCIFGFWFVFILRVSLCIFLRFLGFRVVCGGWDVLGFFYLDRYGKRLIWERGLNVFRIFIIRFKEGYNVCVSFVLGGFFVRLNVRFSVLLIIVFLLVIGLM